MIKQNGPYRYDGSYTHDQRKKVYESYMNKMGYRSYPIFTVVKGLIGNIYGCNISKDSVLIQLKVPEDYCSCHSYYDWTDYMYFFENPYEWKETAKAGYTIDQFFDDSIKNQNLNQYIDEVIQCTIPFIRPKWIEDFMTPINKFTEYHINSPSAKVEDISFYKNL